VGHSPPHTAMQLVGCSSPFAQRGVLGGRLSGDGFRRDRLAARALRTAAGKDYGTGSYWNWTVNHTGLPGPQFVNTESYEPTHRMELVGEGCLANQSLIGESSEVQGLIAEEILAPP